MDESQRRNLQQIRPNQISSLLQELTMAEFDENTTEPLKKALSFLERTRSKMLLPDIPAIVVRYSTLHALLETFRRGTGNFDDLAREAGEHIGSSFAHNILDFLTTRGYIAADEEILLRIWSIIDSGASWGDFQISIDKASGEGTLLIKDSFLLRDLDKNRHRYCSFMEGYALGVIWELFKGWYRLFNIEVTQRDKPCLEPISVKHENRETDDLTCRFKIVFKEEELREPFELLWEAGQLFSQSNYQQSAMNLRHSLELGFKQKMGVEKSHRSSLPELMRVFKDAKIGGLPYKSTKDAYDFLSRTAAHHSVLITRADLQKHMDDVTLMLNSLEKLVLEDTLKQEMKNNLLSIAKDTPTNQ